MKILINRKVVNGPWGGGNLFVKSFVKDMQSFGHTVTHNFSSDLDCIFIQDPRYDELGISINEAIEYKIRNPKVLIFQRINECDARKGTNDVDNLLQQCSKFVDHTFFVSNWMRDYHISKGWACSSNSVLINGVEDFFIPREKIKNGRINIVTHHWSNNPLKGFEIYDLLDSEVEKRDDITFTYIGRDRGSFKNTKLIPPIHGKDLAEELGKYDLYVSASKFDPGPNHILEALACNIPTYSHKDGGGACEFVGSDHVYEGWTDLIRMINERSFSQNSVKTRSWKDCIIELDQKINEIALLKR